jgi:branched-chain amino acid transport system ATP-binding protein
MLKLDNICTYYGLTQVLHNVSLEVKESSVTALLGRNGMGKTTTIHSVINFTPVKSGTIYFKGKEITSLRPHEIVRMGLALVPQGKRVFAPLTVKENLMIGERKREKDVNWTLERVYSLFPILKERAEIKGNLLSGGEQQMLCIGRALMTNADLILMDEPSEGLAPLIIKEIGRVIIELKKKGLSILLVEQNLDLVYDVSDYVYIIDKGSIVYESTTEKLKSNEKTLSNYLLLSRNIT